MAEKASVFQGLQIGVEVTPGAAVAANKKLLASALTLTPKTEGEAFRAMGNKYASFAVINKEWTELGIEDSYATYNEDLYLLASLLYAPTPAQQDATTAYKWSFLSNTAAEDAGKTLTVERGDAVTAVQAAGIRVASLNYVFSRNGVKKTGNGYGNKITTGVAMTAAPASLTAKPILPGHVQFFMADTQAGLAGAAAMTRGFSLAWGITDKSNLAWPVGQDSVSVETVPQQTAALRLAYDVVGAGLIATMRGSTTKWFRVKAIGDVIATTYYQTLQLDFAAQITETGGFSDESGIDVVEYSLVAVHDVTWGKSFALDITTNVSTL